MTLSKGIQGAVSEQIISHHWEAILYADLDGRVQFGNPAAEALYGYGPGELTGLHVDVFNANEEVVNQVIIESVRRDGRWSGEVTQRTKDGRTFLGYLTVFVVLGEDGEPIGFASNSKDISRDKHLVEILKQREEHLRIINAHAPHFIYEVDRAYKILYVNRTIQFSVEEVIGKTVLEFTPPEYHQQIQDMIDHVFTTGDSGEFETKVPFPDGLVMYFNNTVAPVFKDKSVDSVIVMAEDITQRRLQEHQLRDKQARLEAILNNTDSIMMSIDRDCNLIEFNNVLARNVKEGYGIDLKPGDSVFNTIAPSEHEKVRGMYDIVFQGKPLQNIETFTVPNGETLYWETFFSPIRTDGEVTGIVIYTMDISERMRDEAKLKETLKEKEVLLSEIHHRLKNNLAVISGLLQIQSDRVNEPVLREILADSQSKIKTTALVHEMLYENESLVRIKFGDYIRRLVQEISHSYQTDEKDIDVQVNADDVDISIQIAIPCGLFLNESLTNAFKHAFTESGTGQIRIDFKKEGDVLKLAVVDSGKGFPSGFVLEDASTTGLTLLRTFADQLDGRLSLASHGETTFELKFEPEDG